MLLRPGSVACFATVLALAGCAQSTPAPVRSAVHAVELPAPPPPPIHAAYRQSSFNAPATVSIGELPADQAGEPGVYSGDHSPAVFYGDSGAYGYSNHDYYFRPGVSCGGWDYGGYSSHGRTGYITLTPLRTTRARR